MTPPDDKTDQRLDDLVRAVESGFARTNERFAGIDEKLAGIDEKLAGHDKQFAVLDEKLAGHDKQFASLDEKLDGLDRKMNEGFARVDEDIRELRTEMRGLTKTLLHGAIAIVLALIGSHWLPG